MIRHACHVVPVFQTGVAAAQPQFVAGSNACEMPAQLPLAGGATGVMHRPIQYPTPASGVPSLFHTSLPPAVMPQSDPAVPATTQAPGFMPEFPPTSFPFLPNTSAADVFPPNLYYSAAADAARLYAHHMAPFAAATASLYGPAGLSTFLPTPFAANGLQAPKAEGMTSEPAAVDHTDVPAAAGAAAEVGRKRKTPGSWQKKAGRGPGGDVGGSVIARRAANRPPPQVIQKLICCLVLVD